jgi:hypothetical protein
MAEEHITTRDELGTHTTIITDGASRRGGGAWVIGLVLLVAIVVGVFFFSQMSGSEAAKDNAVANAANQVGDAASQVGNAAQNAGNAAQDAAKNVDNR